MRAASSAVSARGLHKRYGPVPAVRGVDLDVAHGSVTVVLGSSGSGKTTLLRLLAGLARPDSGTVCIGGDLVDGPRAHVAPESRRVGYVPQEGSLFPHLTVRANIGFGLRRAGRRQRVSELLEMAGIAELADRYPHQISGGQQQRVALARALAPRPALVLLDEPFSSLDAELRGQVRADVIRMLREQATTAILVSHDRDEALSVPDQVVVLRDGAVAQAAAPAEIYVRPVDPATATLVGEANLLDGVLRGGRATTALGSLPAATAPTVTTPPDDRPVLVLVRPEQFVLAAAGNPDSVRGIVAQVSYHGHDALLLVSLDGLNKPLRVRCAGSEAPPAGARVILQVHGKVVVWPRP